MAGDAHRIYRYGFARCPIEPFFSFLLVGIGQWHCSADPFPDSGHLCLYRLLADGLCGFYRASGKKRIWNGSGLAGDWDCILADLRQNALSFDGDLLPTAVWIGYRSCICRVILPNFLFT